jgi:hypothetical protein
MSSRENGTLTSMGPEGKELEQIKDVGGVWQDLEGILLGQVCTSYDGRVLWQKGARETHC